MDKTLHRFIDAPWNETLKIREHLLEMKCVIVFLALASFQIELYVNSK